MARRTPFAGSRDRRSAQERELLPLTERPTVRRSASTPADYNPRTDLIPALGASTNTSTEPESHTFTISPNNGYYGLWQIFLVIMVSLMAIIPPVEMEILDGSWSYISTVDVVSCSLLILDIVIKLFVEYVDKNTYTVVDSHVEIVMRYATSSLVLDALAAIPIGVVSLNFPAPLKQYGLLCLIRLWRLKRVFDVSARMEKNIGVNYVCTRWLKLIAVAVFSINRAACIFYLLAAYNDDPSNTWIAKAVPDNFRQLSLLSRYIISIYWSVTIFSTIGFGDLHAVNLKEKLVCLIVMFLDCGVGAYVIGNVSQLFITLNTQSYREKAAAATSFANRNRPPAQLVAQMMSHLSLTFRIESEGIQQQEMLNSLPKAMRTNISKHLFHTLLKNVYLFRGVSRVLLLQLVSEIRAEYFTPGQYVIVEDEVPTDFYIIATGAVDLLEVENDTEKRVEGAQEGELCGEISVLCHKPQLFTVRATRLTQLLRINRTAFMSILEDNADDGKIIMKNLDTHLKESRMESILTGISTKEMIQRGRMYLTAAAQAKEDKMTTTEISYSCPELGHDIIEFIQRPRTLEKLIAFGKETYGATFVRVLNVEGDEITDSQMLRGYDSVIFASQGDKNPSTSDRGKEKM